MSGTSTSVLDQRLHVRIRMYRQGLGDCFLLTFCSDDPDFHVLIDCGVFQGTKDADRKMTEVAENIWEETKGTIDLLIVTHEHWDHLSGFVQAREVFDKFTIKTLWLGWTENEEDALASELREDRRRTRVALHAALKYWQNLSVHEEPARQSQVSREINGITTILRFFGEDEDALSANGRSGTKDALDFLKKKAERVVYQYPGKEIIRLSGLKGVRVFVLGPPHDARLLRQSKPTKTSKVYTEFAEVTPEDALLAAIDREALQFDPATAEYINEIAPHTLPFDSSHGLPVRLRSIQQHREVYEQFNDDRGSCSKGLRDIITAYTDDEHMWRSIDYDWLSVSGELALKLDSNTNNTSLAVAFELIDTGEVLLFPGDAQPGNWVSWSSYEWKVQHPGTGETTICRAQDLLGRTVFYKVSHHGSHNGTLSEKGLELMTNAKLVAVIPVDGEMVRSKNWRMPFEPLYEALLEKTRSRLIRTDIGVGTAPVGFALGEESLYFDYVIST